MRPAIDMTDDQFFEFCQINRDLRIERTAQGDILIMTPTGGATGARNLRVTLRLGLWTIQDGQGVAFDSSTGFILPNGATLPGWRMGSTLPACRTNSRAKREVPPAMPRLCDRAALPIRSSGNAEGEDAGIYRQRGATGLADRSHQPASLCLPARGGG